ncbi:amino acid ABC transporter permease [Pseudomonas simiae]|nr:amino acid ABC transporter permease [Pseudomonas simiae]
MFEDLLQTLGLSAFSLKGFGPLLLQGTWMTVKLSVASLAVSVLLGLIGASAKLSSVSLIRIPAQLYTTLIRGVPDLVLMLLIFYSLQIWLTGFTDFMEWDYIEIDPFSAGVITLGFIYGAYFTETFRGAILAVPRGQLEAATAYGLTRGQRFRFVTFPQMMRFALPGIGNNWMVMLKATALVSIIGLADLVKAAQDAGKSTYQLFYFLVLAALIYLLITSASNFVLRRLERRYSAGSREPCDDRTSAAILAPLPL